MLPSQYLKNGWCQHTNALDENDYEVLSYSENAIKYCIHGAIYASWKHKTISLNIKEQIIDRLNEITFNELGYNDGVENDSENDAYYSVYNDTPGRTQEEMIKLMKQVEKEFNLT